MKAWYQWFYLSLCYGVGGVINYYHNKRIISAIVGVCLTATLAFVQFFCDKKGKKVFRYIGIGVIIILIIWVVYLIISTFS